MRKLDLAGKKFGRLKVLKEAGRKNGNITWECLCDCGKKTICIGSELKSGHVRSCGCLQVDIVKQNKNTRQDLTGQRFNRLLVLRLAGKSKSGNLRWECICDCGNKTIVDAGNLKKGHVQSCGCLNIERVKQVNTTHGGTNDALFKVWEMIKERCLKPSHKSYKDYGGRGITICEEWEHDYQKFKDFALSHGWKRGLQVSRIDNEKGYFPENVNFVTRVENSNNRRNTIFIDFEGKKVSLANLARMVNKNYSSLWSRYRRGLRGRELIS